MPSSFVRFKFVKKTNMPDMLKAMTTLAVITVKGFAVKLKSKRHVEIKKKQIYQGDPQTYYCLTKKEDPHSNGLENKISSNTH